MKITHILYNWCLAVQHERGPRKPKQPQQQSPIAPPLHNDRLRTGLGSPYVLLHQRCVWSSYWNLYLYLYTLVLGSKYCILIRYVIVLFKHNVWLINGSYYLNWRGLWRNNSISPFDVEELWINQSYKRYTISSSTHS